MQFFNCELNEKNSKKIYCEIFLYQAFFSPGRLLKLHNFLANHIETVGFAFHTFRLYNRITVIDLKGMILYVKKRKSGA